jgi:hypothetical protein
MPHVDQYDGGLGSAGGIVIDQQCTRRLRNLESSVWPLSSAASLAHGFDLSLVERPFITRRSHARAHAHERATETLPQPGFDSAAQQPVDFERGGGGVNDHVQDSVPQAAERGVVGDLLRHQFLPEFNELPEPSMHARRFVGFVLDCRPD